jgi:hypothetical protein
MKAKLIKHSEPDFYFIANNDGTTFATTDEWYFGKTKGCYKLSKQNCDELFGVVDVHSLGIEHSKEIVRNTYGGMVMQEWEKESVRDFEAGFNKAMELNKDKVFTLEDIRKAYYVGYEDGKSGATFFQQLIQSLQQPKEIDVVIDMSNIYAVPEPKLDSSGCLILKK